MRDVERRSAGAASPWPRRLALATLLAAIPLVFFGGTVTTLHAGLAIDGWLVLEPGRGDHFLWLYPVDKWFRDVGTFVEHSHRLLGSLVGLLAVATLVATFALDGRRTTRALASAALLGVVVQGVVGGLRVLEKSEDLAFLHGAIAQAVVALLGASWLASAMSRESTGSLRLAWLGAISAYAQIVAGAWLRHGGGVPALAVHGILAAVVGILVILLARTFTSGAPALRRVLLALLTTQFALGFAAFGVVWLGPERASGAAPGLGSSVFPTLHVLIGGSLLLACVAGIFRARGGQPAKSAAADLRAGRAPQVGARRLARLETAR